MSNLVRLAYSSLIYKFVLEDDLASIFIYSIQTVLLYSAKCYWSANIPFITIENDVI